MKRVLLLASIITVCLSICAAYNVQYAGNQFDLLVKKNGEVTLLSSVPANNTIVDRRIDEIILTFSEDILPLQSVEDIKINYTIEPEMKGIFRQRGKNTIVFVPAKPFAPEKKYTLTIKKGILSMDSSVLKNDIKLTVGPVNLKVVYASNTTIHPDSSIYLILNYPVLIEELKKSITLKEGGREIEFEVVKSGKKRDYSYYYYNNYYYTDNEDDTLTLTAIEIKPKKTLKSSGTFKLSIYLKDYMRNSEDYTIYTLGDFKYFHRENIGAVYYNSNSYINIEFSNPVKTEEIFKKVFFINEGKTESLFDYYYFSQSQYFSAYKKLVPGGDYMIKIGENLKDVHGSIIKNPGLYRITAGDYYPFVSFDGGYYNPINRLLLGFSLMNMSDFSLFIKNTSVSEFIKEMAGDNYEYWDKKSYRNWSGKKYTFETKKNILFEDTLDAEQDFGRNLDLGTGIVEYVMGRDTYDINFTYQVTPLRMHSVMTNKNGYIFLTDRGGVELMKGESDIFIYNAKGSQLFSVPVKNGILEMTKPQMKWFTVKYGEAGKFLYAEHKNEKLLMSYYLPEKEKDSRVYLFTDKNLYKLADSVFVTGILRDVEGNNVKYSSVKKLFYSVYNPDYKEVYKGTVSTDKSSIFSLKIMIPDSFKTGYYYVSFTDKKLFSSQVSFTVQEFKEPTFEIKVTSEKIIFKANEKVKIATIANYLSGMKMAGDSIYSTLLINRSSFYSQNFAGFNFYISNDTAKFNSQKFDRADTLSGTGEFLYEQNVYYPEVMNPLYGQYIGSVKGIDKEVISQSVYFTKYSRNSYAGLKISNMSDKDDSTLFETAVCDNDGNGLKGKKLKLRIIRQYSYTDSVPDTLAVKSLSSKVSADSLWMKLEKRAYYTVELEYEKTKVMQSFYYGWWWYYDEAKTITITPDKGLYEIGEMARVKIYSPVSDKKHYYYFNTDSILGINEVKFENDTSLIEIPITKNLINGFYFTVFTLSEDTSERERMRTEYIDVSSESKRLLFEMKTDREAYQPNDTVTIELKTENKKSVNAIITVVDEAVLMLTGYLYQDPMNVFYGYYENDARYANSTNLAYPYYYYGDWRGDYALDGMAQMAPSQAYKMTETSALGDKDEPEYATTKESKNGNEPQPALPQNVAIRKDFTQLPFYTTKVVFSKGNDGNVKFRLPDNIGKFRISCVVMTEDEFNVKSSEIRVEKKIIINQSLPLFLRPFDKVDAAFVVLDNTETEGDIVVGINSEQMKFSSKQSSKQKPINNKTLALFNGETMFEDSAVFVMSAEKAGFSDYVMVSIPVINHNLYEHSSVFSSSEESVKEHINISNDIVKEKSSITVSLNSTIIGGMELPLEYLKDYRYLCLEQKLSRAFPFIIGEEVINLYNLSSIKKDKLRKYVSNLLKDVSKCQSGNGGFKYYEDDQYESEYLSLYAMYVLHYASKAGYNIDSEILNRGLEYIELLVDNNFNNIWSYSENAKHSLRTMAVYIMMLYGKNEYRDIVSEVYEKRDRLYLPEKARLLEVLSAYSMTREYNQLLLEIKSNAKIESAYAYFDDGVYDWWFFSSDLKSTAVVLTTLMRTEKKYEYAEYVMNLFNTRLKKGMWINTHTTALVLEAITEYYRIYEKETPLFTAYLNLNEKSLAVKKFSGRKDQKYSYEIEGSAMKDSMNILELKKNGKGRMYYTLRMKYARNKVEHELFNGFEVKREYLDLKGDSVKAFKKGEVYQVKITIKTNKWRSFVVLEDNLPAGFEVIKKEFVTEFANLAHYSGKRWWWGEFYHEEFYRDRIVANSIYLYEGTHDYTYFVKANVSGEFNAPPANVFEMYTPEVFGYTSSNIIKIE
ncbi:MAG: MG2 domain-containing protein [bacterium]